MKRLRYFAIGTLLIAALTASAQQPVKGSNGTDKTEHGQQSAQAGLATVEQQLHILTVKLALSGDQQARFKPILQNLHDATQKAIENKSLSREERMAKVRPQFYETDKQMREILSEDQKKKLDQYEQAPHPEMHGNMGGETASPVQSPQQ